MFTCPRCGRSYLVGQGWQPPSCIFTSAQDLRKLPDFEKYFFTHIECLCGQHIGVQVLSGPQQEIGYWRIQFDALQMSEVEKQVILMPQIRLSQQDLKFMFEKQLSNNAFEIGQVQKSNSETMCIIERLIKINKRKKIIQK